MGLHEKPRPEAHAEWGLYKILEYMGLHEKPPLGDGHNRAKLHKDIEESHIAYNINFDADLLSTFLSHRPDGLAFEKGKKNICTPGIHQSYGQKRRLGHKERSGERRKIQHLSGLYQSPLQKGKSGWKVT